MSIYDGPHTYTRVKRFNANAVMNFNNDLRMLESFADEKFHCSGLAEFYSGASFKSCMIEARQLMNLLSSSQPENFMFLGSYQCYIYIYIINMVRKP